MGLSAIVVEAHGGPDMGVMELGKLGSMAMNDGRKATMGRRLIVSSWEAGVVLVRFLRT